MKTGVENSFETTSCISTAKIPADQTSTYIFSQLIIDNYDKEDILIKARPSFHRFDFWPLLAPSSRGFLVDV